MLGSSIVHVTVLTHNEQVNLECPPNKLQQKSGGVS
jgi:hypothetical protein